MENIPFGRLFALEESLEPKTDGVKVSGNS
jgi:hypothetical protein